VARNHKRILIVDDDVVVLHLLERDFSQAGFAVLTAVNGRAALDTVVKEPVDLIVSDISMPEMDGLEFCERIRRSPDHQHVPFIFLTARGGQDERLRGLRSGADEYVVKPFNVADLIARAEILYDRIQRQRSVSTFEGNLRDVSLCEVLQLFELTRKRGVLHVHAPTGAGTIALADGTLLHASWNGDQAEDAVFHMFALKEGNFRFQAKEVSPGNCVQPISFVLMETARLTDELATFEDHIPPRGAPLVLLRPYDGEDTDAHLVSQALADGGADFAALARDLPLSDVRLRLTLGKLVEGGFVTARTDGQDATARAGEKPAKILVAFTDDATLSKCLALMGTSAGDSATGSGFSDFSRVTLASRDYDVFCLRGEKRFAFMWELVLKTAEGAVFLLAADADKEHAAFFSARAACLQKPVVRICLGSSLRSSAGVRTVRTADDMRDALASFRTAPR
jgi:DNA-binding response OmpR family regulator